MARVLLAPVVHERLLAHRHVPVFFRGQPRQAARNHAPVPARIRAGVIPHRRRLAERSVVGVQDVDVGPRRELRVQRQPEQPAIPIVVDLRAQVRERRARRVVHGAKHLDDTILLRDKDAAIGAKADRRRIVQPRQHRSVLKPVRQHGRRRRRRRKTGENDHHNRHDDPAQGSTTRRIGAAHTKVTSAHTAVFCLPRSVSLALARLPMRVSPTLGRTAGPTNRSGVKTRQVAPWSPGRSLASVADQATPATSSPPTSASGSSAWMRMDSVIRDLHCAVQPGPRQAQAMATRPLRRAGRATLRSPGNGSDLQRHHHPKTRQPAVEPGSASTSAK